MIFWQGKERRYEWVSDFLKGLTVFGLAFSISVSAVPLFSYPVSAAQDGDGSGKDNFQERIYTFKEIHEMAYYSGLCALPDGQEYENFYCGQRGMGFPPGIRSTAAPGTLI